MLALILGALLLPTVKLYVVALRTLHLIFQQKSMLFDVIDTYKKTYRKDFLHEILQASVHSCAVQHTYDQNELEVRYHEAYIVPCRTSVKQLFCKNNER